jgi:hypothetical protein
MVVNVTGGEMHPEEQACYVNRIQEKFPDRKINEISIKIDGDFVDVHWVLEPLPGFQRIRRITGYLVGTLDRWNDGKRAEEHDRVKHGVESIENVEE